MFRINIHLEFPELFDVPVHCVEAYCAGLILLLALSTQALTASSSFPLAYITYVVENYRSAPGHQLKCFEVLTRSSCI